MKIFVLLAALISSFNSFGQTCIIVVRTRDSLFVGADTKRVNLDSNKSDTICKILKSGNCYYTFTGYSFEDTLIDMNKYFDNTKCINNVTSEFLYNRYEKLINKLNLLYETKKSFYLKNYHKFKWSEAIFFGVEKNEIVTKQLIFELVSDSIQPPIIDTSRLSLDYIPGREFLVHPAGHYNSISSLLYEPNIWKNGIKNGIEKLITIQSNNSPEYVGLPIDIILLSTKGEKWLCPTGKCYKNIK